MLNDKERQELKAMDASLLEHEYFKTPHKASELEAVLAQCRETNADILSRREDLLGFYKKFGISTEMTYEEVKNISTPSSWLKASHLLMRRTRRMGAAPVH